MALLSFFTKLLHFLPAELSHNIGLKSLNVIYKTGILKFLNHNNSIKEDIKEDGFTNHIFFSKFHSKLGIAAGLDKNGDFIDALSSLGVGFIEVGTVTPRPQEGNKKPRLFRDKTNSALVNKMGFNNKGVDYLVRKVQGRSSKIPLGISIGKNFDTPIALAYKDYQVCLEKVYEFADYIAVNISSPNTEKLRELSSKEYLDELLSKLKKVQLNKINHFGYKPLFVKISPDELAKDIGEICQCIKDNSIDGIICTNTSLNYEGNIGNGGVSGKPLMKTSTTVLEQVRGLMGEDFPIIASGGVMCPSDFHTKIDAGANLVQIYTGFIYKGPKLISDIVSS